MPTFFTTNTSLLKLVLLSALCLVIASCSSGFIYKNLDWVIPWYVGDYVELNEEQKARFSVLVDEALVWHKETELPRYQSYLSDLYAKLDQALAEEDVSDIQSFTRLSLESLQQHIVPTLLPLFKTLDVEQQRTFWNNMERKQVEYEEEFIPRSEEEYVNELDEKYTEFAERLLGPLTDKQVFMIDKGARDSIRADDIWLKARRAWLANVKRQYELEGDDWSARVQTAWLNRDPHYSLDEKLKIDQRDQHARQLLLAVINSRSTQQTQHFKQFIEDWQSKLTRWQR